MDGAGHSPQSDGKFAPCVRHSVGGFFSFRLARNVRPRRLDFASNDFRPLCRKAESGKVLFTDVPGIQRDVQHPSDDEKPKVASRRRHLRPEEAAKLIAAAGKRGRYPERDKLLRLAYPQGLRAAVLGAIRPLVVIALL
jgi:hypothetical protein